MQPRPTESGSPSPTSCWTASKKPSHPASPTTIGRAACCRPPKTPPMADSPHTPTNPIRYDGCMKLTGKIVFLTGASSGIGESTAYAFAAEGARLILCSRRKDKVDAVARQALEKGAPAVHTFELDVRD